MSKNTRIYFWVSLSHFLFIIIWATVYKESNSRFSEFAAQTFFLSHGGFWFFNLSMHFMIEFHTKRNNNLMMLWSYAVPLIGMFALGIMGINGLITSYMQQDYGNTLKSTISLFWAYGLLQALLNSINGEELMSNGLSKKNRIKSRSK
jgi:hypothetical protein